MMRDPLDAGDLSRSSCDRAISFDPAETQRASQSRHWSRRRHLERQLHDGPALRLSALTLRLGLLQQKVSAGETHVQADIDDLQGELHTALQELRGIAEQIYPPLLSEAGLGPALRELADRARINVSVDVPDERYDAEVEGIAYFEVLELLDALGAAPACASVRISRDGRCLRVDVDGVEAAAAGTMTTRIPCG